MNFIYIIYYILKRQLYVVNGFVLIIEINFLWILQVGYFYCYLGVKNGWINKCMIIGNINNFIYDVKVLYQIY